MVRLIRQLRAKSVLSNSQLAALAGVDPGQTSRILEGRFRTVSGNVLRICNVLGLNPYGEPPAELTATEARKRAAWAKLEASVRRAWDETPQGADRLVAVIDAVANLRFRQEGEEPGPHGSRAGKPPT